MELSNEQPGARSFYIVDSAGFPVRVHIQLGLMRELGFEVMEAFKSVPKRGLEIGGILLGRVDVEAGTIAIEGYQRVESQHEKGPSYLLSELDWANFSTEAQQWLGRRSDEVHGVGFFRSQTRSGMEFDDQDNAIAREIFKEDPPVCLLIKPRAAGPSVAQMGIWIENMLRPFATFPFQESVLREGGSRFTSLEESEGWEQYPPSPHGTTESAVVTSAVQSGAAANAPAPDQARPASAEPLAQEELVEEQSRRSAPFKYRNTAAAVLVGAVAVGAAFVVHSARRPTTRVVSTQASSGSSIASPPSANLHSLDPADLPVNNDSPSGNELSLHVERKDGSAILSWNHASPAIQKAEYGDLIIAELSRRQEIRLDREELKTGRVVYVPKTADVRFEMKLFAPAHSTAESIRSVADSTTNLASTHRRPFNDSAARASLPKEGEARVVREPQQLAKKLDPANTESSSQSPLSSPALDTVASGSKPVPLAPEPIPAAELDAKPKRIAEPRLITTVSVEPIAKGSFRRILGDISPTRLIGLRSAPGQTVPARALRQAQPELSPQALSELHGNREIGVKVTISRTGTVTRTETDSDQRKDPVGLAVLDAARQWKFAPARQNGKPVEEQALLRFRLRRTVAGGGPLSSSTGLR